MAVEISYRIHKTRCIQTTASYPVPLRFILILTSLLRLGLLNGLFPSWFPTKFLHAFLICIHTHTHTHTLTTTVSEETAIFLLSSRSRFGKTEYFNKFEIKVMKYIPYLFQRT